jgi:BirA family biotin operon repressor/biotin-[acetyl-CoA-carboxylase] ligase
VIYLGFNLISLNRVDSTNNYLKKLVSEGSPHKTAVLAETQSGGRGRQGKSFASPPGGIYISFYYNFADMKEEYLPLVTPIAAVYVSRAIESASGQKVKIKWVNDIYFNDKKICGILTERVADTLGFIVGVGINLSGSNLPDNLKDKAGYIDTDKDMLVKLLIENMDFNPEMFGDFSNLAYYRENSYLAGKKVGFTLNGCYITGIVKDVDEKFRLAVETEKGLSILDSGEVSVLVI